MGQRLTELVRVVSGGLIGKLKAPVSILCKVQSCVTYWHTHVCLKYHGVLCCVLKKTTKKKRLQSVKKTLTMSSPLFSTWARWIQSCWKYKWDAASTEVSCFLYLLILCDCSLFFLFYFLFSRRKPGWQPSSRLRIQTTMLCTLLVHGYVTNAHGPHGFSFCIRTACLCVMCLLLWKGRRLAVCLLPSSWNLSVPLGSWAQVYRTAEAALTARLISFGARHAALPLAAWTGFVPFLPLYIHKLYI